MSHVRKNCEPIQLRVITDDDEIPCEENEDGIACVPSKVIPSDEEVLSEEKEGEEQIWLQDMLVHEYVRT